MAKYTAKYKIDSNNITLYSPSEFGVTDIEDLTGVESYTADVDGVETTGIKIPEFIALSANLEDALVTSLKIANLAVDDTKLAELAVTSGKLAQESVKSTVDQDGVCLAQTKGGAGDLTINGAYASGGTATLTPPQKISVYSTGDLSSVTFTIYGTDSDDQAQNEAVTGPDNTTVYTTNNFKTVTQVAVNAAVGTNVEVGGLDSKIEPTAIRTAHIAEAAIGAAAIANLAVGSAKIADLAVGSAKIDDLAVTSAKINDVAANKITAGIISAAVTMGHTFIVNSSGAIYSSGKTSASDTTPGFFMGYDGGAYKLTLGGSGESLTWDGSNLAIGSGTSIAGTAITGIENGATAGATWGSNISNEPTQLSNINSGEGSKLSGIENGATANSSDATLLARANHTGTQGASSLDATVISGGKIITGLLTASNIQTGTLNASVVTVSNINAANITTGTITASNCVVTGNIQTDNVTDAVSTSSATDSSALSQFPSWTTIATCSSVDTDGYDVHLSATIGFYNTGGGATSDVYVEFYDSTNAQVIGPRFVGTATGPSASYGLGETFTVTDTGASGTSTYIVRASLVNPRVSHKADFHSMLALVTKR